MALYVAMKLGREPVECRFLHNPVDGWAWMCCPDLGALLREVARSLLSGLKPSIATPRGPLDPLKAEACLSELEDPRLEGCFEVLVEGRRPTELLELGASSVAWRPGSPIATASFNGARVVALLEQGFVPLVWRKLVSASASP
jgi:hypothetical protein